MLETLTVKIFARLSIGIATLMLASTSLAGTISYTDTFNDFGDASFVFSNHPGGSDFVETQVRIWGLYKKTVSITAEQVNPNAAWTASFGTRDRFRISAGMDQILFDQQTSEWSSWGFTTFAECLGFEPGAPSSCTHTVSTQNSFDLTFTLPSAWDYWQSDYVANTLGQTWPTNFLSSLQMQTELAEPWGNINSEMTAQSLDVFSIWGNIKVTHVFNGAEAIPEPHTGFLLLAGLPILLSARRKVLSRLRASDSHHIE